MGRQTSVALSEEDEQAFLVFLRGDADIRIYRKAAVNRELFCVPSFSPRASGEWVFTIWNTEFPGQPE